MHYLVKTGEHQISKWSLLMWDQIFSGLLYSGEKREQIIRSGKRSIKKAWKQEEKPLLPKAQTIRES
jgi:hypothetical protein